MSDKEQESYDPDKTAKLDVGTSESMTNRLASLRASIRSSKDEKPKAEGEKRSKDEESDDETPDDLKPTTTVEAVAAENREPVVADDGDVPLPGQEKDPARTTDDLHRIDRSDVAELPPALSGQDDAAADVPPEAVAVEDEDLGTFEGDTADPEYRVGPTQVKALDEIEAVEGTPLYMSPEQCQGSTDIGPGTDVYALGVMLFELLEGRPPFAGRTVDEVLIRHQDAAVPEQESEFTPDAIKDLVKRMLAKDPLQRPSTGEIISTLQSHAAPRDEDVHGLEEESWSVAEIDEDEVDPPVAGTIPAEADGPETTGRGPLLFVGFAFAVLLGFAGALAVVGGGEDAEPEQPAEIAADDSAEREAEQPVEPEPGPEESAPEEPADEIAAEEVAEPDDDGFEFAMGESDAGVAAGSDDSADAGATEVAEVEEPPEETAAVAAKEEPKREKKPRRTKKRPPKKKDDEPKLRELRLDL